MEQVDPDVRPWNNTLTMPYHKAILAEFVETWRREDADVEAYVEGEQ